MNTSPRSLRLPPDCSLLAAVPRVFRRAISRLSVWFVMVTIMPAAVAQRAQEPTITLDAPESARVGELITLGASRVEFPGSVRYRFVYSDAIPSESDWGSKPLSLRLFTGTGDVRVYVEARPQGGQPYNVAGTPLKFQPTPAYARSAEKTIHVLPALPTVSLRTATKKPTVGQPVVWNVARTPKSGPLEYEFDPGDNTGVLQANGPTIEHTYATARKFTASVRLVNEESRPVARVAVNVAAAPAPILDPLPEGVEIREEVGFSATYPARDAATRFRFYSGDNEPPTAWSGSNLARHAYTRDGKFAPFVEVTRAKGPNAPAEARSAARTIVVRPALSVSLEPSPNRADVGDEISFKIETNRPETAPRVMVDFGDGERSVVTVPGIVSHIFKRVSSFDVTVVAEAKIGRATAQQRVAISALAPPALELSSPTTEIGSKGQFTATFRAADRRTRYRFKFGDDAAPSPWSTSPRVEHSYEHAGTFQASVEVGIALAGEQNGEPLVVGSSPTREVTVRPAFSVTIRPTANEVRAGEEATFAVTTTRPDLAARYAFAFSDGAKIQPSNSTTVAHIFLNPGDQRVSVSATSPLGPAKDETGIRVTAPVPPSLAANPSPAEIGEPVKLTVSPAVDGKQFRYRFDFNDGSAPSEWLAALEIEHAFGRDGSFHPSVEVGVLRDGAVGRLANRAEANVAVSPALQVSLRPVETEIYAERETHFAVETNRPGSVPSLDLSFGDGTPAGSATGPTVAHVFPNKGSYHLSWTARTGRAEAKGAYDITVRSPPSPPAVWALAAAAALATGAFAGHRLGWLRPSLHVKTNLRSWHTTVKQSPNIEIDYRLNRNLAGRRHRLVVEPSTPVEEPWETHV